jgi:hypothetical protein
MEIVVFKDQKWTEISKQDNPAFDYIYENQRLQEGFKGRRTHCFLICKVLPYEESVGKNGYAVIEVPLKGDVIRRGLFWKLEDAEVFADRISGTFESATKPLMKYMAEKHHPHVNCIVTSTDAVLSEGLKSIVSDEYLID